jgi:hypothetical protein
MNKLVLPILIGLLIGACASPATPTPQVFDGAAAERACGDAGGKYVTEFRECENVSAASCKAMGGSFNECASACRHMPEGTMCTAQCVPVCSF